MKNGILKHSVFKDCEFSRVLSEIYGGESVFETVFLGNMIKGKVS